MKFMMGHWLMKPNITPAWAVEYYSHRFENNELTLLVPVKHVAGRSDTQIGALHVKLFTPAEGVLGVTVTHHGGEKRCLPDFEKSTSSTVPVVTETEDTLSFQTGELDARVNKKPSDWKIEYIWKGKTQPSTGYRAMA